MLSVPVWINSKTASEYHTESADNYYKKNGELGFWYGSLAKEFELEGEIDADTFKKLLDGKDPRTEKQLVQVKESDGNRKRAALDLTFSAPKSISILYETARSYDKPMAIKIQRAHEDAVRSVLRLIEKEYAYTRVGKEYKREKTSNLLFAAFTHDVSRPVKEGNKTIVDPSLHTHALILNMTKSSDGKFRTIEPYKLFKNFKTLGLLYRTQLAANLREIGIEMELTDSTQGLIEIKNFPKELIEEFSKRSEQINESEVLKELKELYPDKPLGELKQLAAYKTREFKGEIDRDRVRKENIERIESLGYDPKDLLDLSESHNAHYPKQSPSQIVKSAIEAISYEKSVFELADILSIAAGGGLQHRIGYEELQHALDEILAQKDGTLIDLEHDRYTTKEIVQAEKYILTSLKQTKNRITPMASKPQAKKLIEEYSSMQEFPLTKGQKKAIKHILTASDMIIGIQGDAGTGKTTMLKALNYLKEDHVRLIGLSFTGKAAAEIENKTSDVYANAGIPSQTIASFLQKISTLDDISEYKNSKIIIDEASMVGVRDLKKLVHFAKKVNAQLILMGDTKQFKALQAGDPFALLQEKGMKTVRMSDVIRQKDPTLKKAVKALNDYDPIKAFDILDRHGKITQIEEEVPLSIASEVLKDFDHSHAYIGAKEEYSDTLILTNSNKLKDQINQTIRSLLKEKQKIDSKEFTFQTLEQLRLNNYQKFFAKNFEQADIIFHLRSSEPLTLEKIDDESNSLILKGIKSTTKIDLDKEALNLIPYRKVERSFSVGDRVVFEKNDKELGVHNGDVGYIRYIDREGNFVVKMEKKTIEFNINDYSFLNHAYALTTYKSQGQTSQKVIAYLNANLQNFNSFYVTVTRAVKDLKIFTNDKERLKEVVSFELKKSNVADIKEIDKVIRRGEFRKAIEKIEDVDNYAKNFLLQNILKKFKNVKQSISTLTQKAFSFLKSNNKVKQEAFFSK